MAPAVARDKQPKPADPHAIAIGSDGVLPTDVLYEILLRLAANVLRRLRLVCRSWRSLTSDPRFTREHSSRHPLFAGLEQDEDEIHIVDLSGNIVKRICPGNHLGSYCLSTQGDLVACVSWTDSKTWQALLLNPATGAVDVLPSGRVCPRASTCLMGHVASTGEYKLLRMGYGRTIQQPCEIMTLGCGSDQRWRTKPDPPFPTIISERSHIAVFNGFIYFLLPQVSSDTMERIGLFDLAKEEWRAETLQLPLITALRYEYDPLKDEIQLAKFDGHFAIVHHNNRHCCSMNFWLLEDMDKGLWNKQCSIQCAPYLEHLKFHPPYLFDRKIVMYLERTRVLVAYDPRTSTWMDLATLEYHYHPIRMYEGSLL